MREEHDEDDVARERESSGERDGEEHLKQQQQKQREAWGSAYFKSTDGHTGEWSFSLRRLNLQLFEVIGACGGYVLNSTLAGIFCSFFPAPSSS